MQPSNLSWTVLLFGLVLIAAAHAVAPSASELAQARRWAAQNLGRVGPSPAPAAVPAETAACLTVNANHDDVLLNGRPDGRPLQIGADTYEHGLLCHAPSELVVRLPGPGRAFTAMIGIDANAGGGSVVFSVAVEGTEAFDSGVVRHGDPVAPISLELHGARTLTLAASDAGDGIACDHAVWAEAAVALEDGTTVRLSDLPLRYPMPPGRVGETPPFAFTYGGRHSDELLPGWEFTEASEAIGEGRTRWTRAYSDPGTGLEVRCVSVTYADFPVVEWTVTLRNAGTTDTPLIEGLQGLDSRFGPRVQDGFVLHHNVGSPCQPNDYQPLETPLGPVVHKRIGAAGGRPTNGDLCYFNLEWPGAGVIIALGWPGQWAAHFLREDGAGVRVVAGQEQTHFVLHPGEQVRTPLVVLLFWEGGDWIRAQNLWRRWMMAHSMPDVGGKPIETHYGVCFSNLQPLADEELLGLATVAERELPIEYYFLDAGWYPDRGGWWNTGTWEVDRERFPNGVREVMDRAHASGMKTVLWFEPERCVSGTWLTENHPEWVLGGADGGLLNLGNAEAWAWAVERFSGLIESEGVDVYRQDYNIDPLSYWRANDAENRQGITENHYVTGYLAYWDELRRRHPGMYIDSCASGGRRNDLETLRRAVPLLRSDYFVDPTTQQAQTMGIALWMPYFGSGQGPEDEYFIRSGYFPASRTGWNPNDPPASFEVLRRLIAECAEVQRCMDGDFYPLTPWSLEETVWAAWQWHRSGTEEGVVQAFRRAECPEQSLVLKLRGLDPGRVYLIRNADGGPDAECTGQELMETGLRVVAPRPRQAVVLMYSAK